MEGWSLCYVTWDWESQTSSITTVCGLLCLEQSHYSLYVSNSNDWWVIRWIKCNGLHIKNRLESGYHQVSVWFEYITKTTFQTHKGHYDIFYHAIWKYQCLINIPSIDEWVVSTIVKEVCVGIFQWHVVV